MINKWFKKYLAVILISSLVGTVGFLVWETRAELIFKEARQWQIASDAETLTIRPSTDTATEAWLPYLGGNNVDEVNEAAADGDNSYVYSGGSGDVDEYDLDDSGGLTGTISNVTVYMYARNTIGNEKIIFGVNSGGTIDTTTYVIGSDYTVLYSRSMDLDPNGGISWDWPAIDALLFYAKSKNNGSFKGELRITQAYVVVTYSAAASLSFGIDSASLDFGSLSPGTPITDKTSILTVTTDNADGFNIKASRDDSDTTLDLGTDAGVNITDQTAWNSTTPNSVIKTSLDNSGDVLAFRVRQSGTDSSNYNSTWWGSDDTDGNALFAGFPTPSDTIVNRGSPSDPSTDSVVQYYIDVVNTQQTGTYDGGVTYTATMN